MNGAALASLVLAVFLQPSLSVKDVMRRVERYVAAYGEQASIVVSTERYEQQASGSGSGTSHRTLVSDFAIVHADAIHGWLGFRDVLEVDGHTVADRDGRLARVLMASQGRFDEARRLSDESARYNVGAIERNFNVPTTALFFFTEGNHDRFKFTARTVGGDGWEIAFKETDRPTLIRDPNERQYRPRERSGSSRATEPSFGRGCRSRPSRATAPARGAATGRSMWSTVVWTI